MQDVRRVVFGSVFIGGQTRWLSFSPRAEKCQWAAEIREPDRRKHPVVPLVSEVVSSGSRVRINFFIFISIFYQLNHMPERTMQGPAGCEYFHVVNEKLYTLMHIFLPLQREKNRTLWAFSHISRLTFLLLPAFRRMQEQQLLCKQSLLLCQLICLGYDLNTISEHTRSLDPQPAGTCKTLVGVTSIIASGR